MEWKQGEFTISDAREELDIEIIHNFLRESYWAKESQGQLWKKL